MAAEPRILLAKVRHLSARFVEFSTLTDGHIYDEGALGAKVCEFIIALTRDAERVE